jgi:hypothetical protein
VAEAALSLRASCRLTPAARETVSNECLRKWPSEGGSFEPPSAILGGRWPPVISRLATSVAGLLADRTHRSVPSSLPEANERSTWRIGVRFATGTTGHTA